MLNFDLVKSKQIERRRLRRSRNLERLCNNRVCNACGKFMNRFGKKHKKYQVSFSISMLVTSRVLETLRRLETKCAQTERVLSTTALH